jgi:hypothetical protein
MPNMSIWSNVDFLTPPGRQGAGSISVCFHRTSSHRLYYIACTASHNSSKFEDRWKNFFSCWSFPQSISVFLKYADWDGLSSRNFNTSLMKDSMILWCNSSMQTERDGTISKWFFADCRNTKLQLLLGWKLSESASDSSLIAMQCL